MMLRQSMAAAVFRLIFFSCLFFASTGQGNSRQCYDVGNETVCYFRPADDFAMDWNNADEFCRNKNATLPVILNKDHQTTIEKYLSQFPLRRNASVFTAGRKSWSLDPNYAWRWVNGKQIRSAAYIGHTLYDVYWKELVFGCIFPRLSITVYGLCPSILCSFVCQYPESICKTMENTMNHLQDRNHCLVIYGDRLNWYSARNKCIEGGGDLAVFDDVDSLETFPNFTSAPRESYPLWIGLQQNWWTWRARDAFDIRYTNWPQRERYFFDPEEFSGLDCLCLNGSNNFIWMNCNCTEGGSFICQSVTEHHESLKERSKSDSLTDRFSNVSRCYDVNGTQVCYFTPKNATRLNFASASQWCKDHNATLPIIRTKFYQKALESFLEAISLPIYFLWTSGRNVNTESWSWINGQPFRESDIGDVPQYFSFTSNKEYREAFEKKGQLVRSFFHDSKPSETGYVCHYSDHSCKNFSNGVRTRNKECLVANEEQVSWYEARNLCIDSGGDLATFEDFSIIEKLVPRLTLNKPYHIGLENSRWIWHHSEKLENLVQYTNWKKSYKYEISYGPCIHEIYYDHVPRYNDEYFCFPEIWILPELGKYPRCLCIETFNYKWIPCDCNLDFRFVCQKEMCGPESNQGLIMAGVEGLIIAVLAIVVVSLVIRLRKKTKTGESDEPDVPCEMDNRYASVNPTTDMNPTVYQDLKLYEEVQ